MELAAKIIVLLACAVNFEVQILYFVHMIQLTTYRPERFNAWCRENFGRVFSPKRYVLPAVVVAAGFAGAQVWTQFLSAGILLMCALINRPQKAKKKLVFTARIKRLLVTVNLFLAASLLAAYFSTPSAMLWLIGLFSMPIVIWALVANILNQPIERAVQNYYINDAKKLLKQMPDMTIIGITGSYGKTSTKNYLTALLATRYNVLMTPESYNTPMGVVRTIREKMKPSHQIFVCEMGACRVGEIKEICDIVHPHYGLLTSIGEQHLETFGSVQNIINTKFELADALPQDGILFANEDNEFIREHPIAVKRIGYTVEGRETDYVASGFSANGDGCGFTITTPTGESRRFTTKLLGAHNIQNLAGCIAVAHTLGIPLEELVYPVRMLKPVEHRLQLLPNGFIDDAFNSNPAGFRAALDVLRMFKEERVLVTPGMVELGELQYERNRELGEYAADCCDLAILVGERQAPPLKDGLLVGGFPEEKIHVVNSLNEGLDLLKTMPAEGKRTVLLENDLPDTY